MSKTINVKISLAAVAGIIWMGGGFEVLLWFSSHSPHPSPFLVFNLVVGWLIWIASLVTITAIWGDL